MNAGVVGHVEWVDVAFVDRVPAPGAIVHAHAHLADPGGGGAVAAVQMRRLLGAATFLTAVGDDGLGARTAARLREELGEGLHAAVHPRPQRRAFSFTDRGGERTITVLGSRCVPAATDPLPWAALAALDAVYVTAGDAGAIRAARAARVLVATPRALPGLAEAGVRVDVLVGSAGDPDERAAADALDPAPAAVVLTEGAAGGAWRGADGARGRWAAHPPPAPAVDLYGAGDTFAAALTVGLGGGLELAPAVAYAARAAACCVAERGPYGADVGAVGPPA